MVPAAKEESEGGQECDFLDAKFLEATYMRCYILPIEVKFS